MSVKIRIKGNHKTNEYKDAIVLKEIFEKEFINTSAKGEILIISNATLFGQDTKDVDLIVIGKLDQCIINVKTKTKTDRKKIADANMAEEKERALEIELEQRKERVLSISDFCFVIEVKGHCAEDIQLEGPTLLVRYNGRLHDVTTQSESQKYSLLDYFKDRINNAPHICNFIWLKNIGSDSLKKLLGDNLKIIEKHNYLPNVFGLRWLFTLACLQSTPFIPINPIDSNIYKLGKYCYFSSWYNKLNYGFHEMMNEVFDVFVKAKQGMGDLTRKKLKLITADILKDQQYVQAIGEKLVIISGRAGTGKTIKLLNIACDLVVKREARVLILTYNHALVGDIKRIFTLEGIPDDVDSYSANISTLHKFFYELLCGFEIGTTIGKNDKVFIDDYIDKYYELLKEFYEYIYNDVIKKQDLEKLMTTRHQQIAWDYVLIDEAQDWDDMEKELIYFIFGKEKVIVADGLDQLVRSQKKCDWTQGGKSRIDFFRAPGKKGLRQKCNLIHFVNQVAEKLDVTWGVEPETKLYGGKIIVKIGDYTRDLHDRELKICKDNKNSAFDMMFLVPPGLVTKKKERKYGKDKTIRSFCMIKEYEEKGIKIWDGTNTDLRTEYPVSLEEHRLFQYESCRGLEGWTVVCLELDEFMDYKFKTFKEVDTGRLLLEAFEEKRNKFVSLWTLIPLTRAIDTLIITIKDSKSKIAKVLKDIAQNNPDNIEWIID